MKRALLMILALAATPPACLAAGAEPPLPRKVDAPRAKPQFVSSQWQSLYLSRQKIGYLTLTIYRFPDGGYRFESGLFLRKNLGAEKFGYFKTITAEVGADGRPRALDCQVGSGPRRWHVKGHTEDGALVLARTVGPKKTTARISLEPGLTFRSWALHATVLGNSQAGQTSRWLVIDESLGALLPDACVIHVLGERTIPAGTGKVLRGTAVASAHGPERVAHLVGPHGRVLRSMWQSSPLIAEGTGLTEARRLADAALGPPPVAVEGLAGDRYRNARLGYSLRVPLYPFVASVNAEAGLVQVGDLTDEACVTVRPAADPRLIALGYASAPEADHLANLVHHHWAARYEEVKTEPPQTARVAGRQARVVNGTARLGCTTFHFRNIFLSGEGFAFLVTAALADRPLSKRRVLLDNLVASLRLTPPEGRLPILTRGNRFRSPYYGFELRRPNERWKVPMHRGGPPTALELARDDRSVVAIVRVLTPNLDQTLADFVADRAQRVADDLGLERPKPKPTTLDGRKALEITYEGNLLAGGPARCRAVYTRLNSRIFGLLLVASGEADEAVQEELASLCRSVRFLRPPRPEKRPEAERGPPAPESAAP